MTKKKKLKPVKDLIWLSAKQYKKIKKRFQKNEMKQILNRKKQKRNIILSAK